MPYCDAARCKLCGPETVHRERWKLAGELAVEEVTVEGYLVYYAAQLARENGLELHADGRAVFPETNTGRSSGPGTRTYETEIAQCEMCEAGFQRKAKSRKKFCGDACLRAARSEKASEQFRTRAQEGRQ